MSHLPIAYPVAVGAAWAYQRAGDGRVAMAICGDGATSNGRWHESINTSAIMRLPVVWVVNNNQFAYSTPNEREFAVPTIAERAAAYGIPGVRVDGDGGARGVRRRLARRSSARAPVAGRRLIEAVSLRWRGHAGHDPAKYVPRELLEHYMLSKGPREELRGAPAALRRRRRRGGRRASRQRVEQAFDEAHEFALASPFPEPGDVSKGVWVEDGYWRSEPGRGGGTEAG